MEIAGIKFLLCIIPCILRFNIKGRKMEKETNTSYNLQIKIPQELKEKLEAKAREAGVSLNQYIMFMFVAETKR